MTQLVDAIVERYLQSGDFNGLYAGTCIPTFAADLPALKEVLRLLVAAEEVALNFGTVHVNPHIRAFEDLPIPDQLELLALAEAPNFVIYPTAKTLQGRVDPKDYAGKPFTLRLALGEPQLSFVSFDLSVLDSYRRDPRYRFWTDDAQATLSVTDEAYLSDAFPEKHKVLIQHFGFSYLDDNSRAVAVFLTDLSGLTLEHQQIWNALTVEGDYKLHPDYFRSAIQGDWGLRITLRDALIHELVTINKMCEAIGWKPFFREIPDDTPHALSFLLRPTRHDYWEFLLIADKLLSENINKDFFPASIPRQTQEQKEDGTLHLRDRGTLAMLEDWLAKFFRLKDDPEVIPGMIASFKELRRLRQQPAHSLKPNEYDRTLFDDQRKMFIRIYDAVRTLRMILANHPLARPIDKAMDQRVHEGKIWNW